jgi:hypothetical protein
VAGLESAEVQGPLAQDDVTKLQIRIVPSRGALIDYRGRVVTLNCDRSGGRRVGDPDQGLRDDDGIAVE